MAPETIEQALTRYLGENGLWPEEATAIISGRWNDPAREYPAQLRATLVVSLNSIAVEWIDKHAPKHWARPMFAGFDAA